MSEFARKWNALVNLAGKERLVRRSAANPRAERMVLGLMKGRGHASERKDASAAETGIDERALAERNAVAMSSDTESTRIYNGFAAFV